MYYTTENCGKTLKYDTRFRNIMQIEGILFYNLNFILNSKFSLRLSSP